MGLFSKDKAEKIKITLVSEEEFESLFNKITEKNELLRCPKCGKLCNKTSKEGTTVQHRGFRGIVIDGDIMEKCPDCGQHFRF